MTNEPPDEWTNGMRAVTTRDRCGSMLSRRADGSCIECGGKDDPFDDREADDE